MDTFSAIVLISLTVTVLALLAIGKWSSRSPSDIQNKDRLLRWGVQFEIEGKEIRQMLEAQNEYRRRRGQPEISGDEFRAMIEAEQLERVRQADQQHGDESRTHARNRERRGF
jgi:hypothetical protein